MWPSPPCYFSKKFGAHIKKGIDLHAHGKKFHSFHAFELILHLLAEEGILNMHSNILLSLTPGVCERIV